MTARSIAADNIPEAFAAALFGSLAGNGAEIGTGHRDEIAATAWRHLQLRAAGRPDVRVANILPEDGGAEYTVVEIVDDNMPFLVDSAMAVLLQRGLEASLLLHPILTLERDGEGRLVRLLGDAEADAVAGAIRESLIRIEIENGIGESERAALAEELERTFADVRAATRDWHAMRDRLAEAAIALDGAAHVDQVERSEAAAFLRWLLDSGFTVTGMREFSYDPKAENEPLASVEGTGFGILRDPDVHVLRRGRDLVVVTPEIREFLLEPQPIIVTKANLRSRVGRRAHLDLVSVKLYDAAGGLSGELRLVGLFPPAAFDQRAQAIPLLRRKIAAVREAARFYAGGYSERQLINVLETYPRDELFQIDAGLLGRFAVEIMALHQRPHVGVLARADRFDRFVSILVFVPRDRYDSEVCDRIGEYLAEVYDGRVAAYYPHFLEGVALTRVHFIIGRYEGPTPEIPRAELEREVQKRVRTWADLLRAGLREALPAAQARQLAERYGERFEPGYRDAFTPDQAIADIGLIEALTPERRFAIDLIRAEGEPDSCAVLRIILRGPPMPLSQRVPALDLMGFRVVSEHTFRIFEEGEEEAQRVHLHEMLLERASGGAIDLAGRGPLIEDLMMAVADERAESDGYNALTLEAGLDWRRVSLVRAISRFLKQAGISFGADYMWGVLVRHAAIAADVVALFEARFDPAVEDRDARMTAVRARIEAALGEVESLDEDRIIRRFVDMIENTLRTNFYQDGPDGKPRAEISFKLDSRKLDALPAPRPLVEIFVYSPRVEGTHLRYGRIARGGLRWSDRREDFRTEVLGLVKAQQVKNAVIVPVGAKGGFVPKRLPPSTDRAAWLAEGRESYRVFISALLDITDNLVDGAIVPPRDVVRHDGDDPYLVVAADKGTATFSDTANALARDHAFWLDDAFASGGSAGYDHKKMGITACGGWEAVKRHFREMDHDVQTQEFTVAGVGDMSGDVFGNGMLRSRQIRLVAAFDHRDIFLDPDPDAAKSFDERQRLFDLPRSSWADYDKALISPGGGVFSRALKSVPLSPQIRALLGIDAAQATPQEIIRKILMLDVDLLWFGGIGTYIRGSEESDAEAGDRANDAIRITGTQVHAKVLGEGANLGVTQRGRIEAALKGVRLNTDAIDNSAGVNSSDLEVNIKIALKEPVTDGRLDEARRNAFLAEMTDEVADLVLANNYRQTLALSLTERRGQEDLGFAQRLMRTLEARGLLDRAVEVLPDDAALARRVAAGQGLTRPENAVLLAYAKMSFYDDLLDSAVPDDPHLAGELAAYFPRQIAERFSDVFATHRLRREIIATMLTNSVIDNGGPTFVTRLVEQTGASVAQVAAGFTAAFNAFRLPEIIAGLDALDNRIPSAEQMALYGAVQNLLISRSAWFIRNVDLAGDIGALVGRFRDGVDAMFEGLDGALSETAREDLSTRRAMLAQAGMPADLAARLAALGTLYSAPDAVLVAEAAACPVADAANALFAVSDWLGLDRIRARANEHRVTDVYERLAVDQAMAAIATAQRAIAGAIVRSPHDGLVEWAEGSSDAARIRAAIASIAEGDFSLARLSVASGLLGDLARRGPVG